MDFVKTQKAFHDNIDADFEAEELQQLYAHNNDQEEIRRLETVLGTEEVEITAETLTQ